MAKVLIFACFALFATQAYASKKTFDKEYTYRAGDADSKLTSRDNALNELRKQLLREVGEYIRATRRSANGDYSEDIEAITAGVVNMKIIFEDWDGFTYWVWARMEVDPEHVIKQIEEIRQDQSLMRQLEEERRQRQVAEENLERMRQEAQRLEQELERYKTDAARAKYEEAKQSYQMYVENISINVFNFGTEGTKEIVATANKPSAPPPQPIAQPTPQVYNERNDLAIGVWSMHSLSGWGLAYGMCWRPLGFYMALKYDYNLIGMGDNADYHYDQSMYGSYYYDNNMNYRFALTGGLMLRLADWLYLYAGAGYGKYGKAYGYIDEYIYVPDMHKGMEIEAGIMFDLWRWLSVSAGYGALTLTGKDGWFSDFHLGVGIFWAR